MSATLPAADVLSELSRRAWRLACVGVLFVATVSRVSDLSLKPLHHDEGVNGFFLLNLMRSGIYHYDPANYHGPTLYYFALPLAYAADKLHHLNTDVIRLVTVLFGVATVWLALGLRRYLGMVGALAAASLIAVSPGAVYLSRYFIHETLFVFFTLGIVVAALRYFESAEPLKPSAPPLGLGVAVASLGLVGSTSVAVYVPTYYAAALALTSVSLVALIVALWFYEGERSFYLLGGTVSAALLFATKETAFISAGVLMLATALACGYVWLIRRRRRARVETLSQRRHDRRTVRSENAMDGSGAAFMTNSGKWAHLALLVVAFVALFLFVNMLFYSSFFTNAKGIGDALGTFKIWSRTASKDHTKPIYTYIRWLLYEESPLLVLGVLGALFAVWRGRNLFAVFAALWAFGILAAYSLVGYKTPWLTLNITIPLALIAGYALESLYTEGGRDSLRRTLALALGGVALVICLSQAVALNFFHYDDDHEFYVYVYAHTRREFLRLIEQVDQLARRAGTGLDTSIDVASPDYWPMPWYFRDYKHVGYPQRVGPTSDPIIIANVTQESQLISTFGERYQRVGGVYALRPGVELVLYARRDLVVP